MPPLHHPGHEPDRLCCVCQHLQPALVFALKSSNISKLLGTHGSEAIHHVRPVGGDPKVKGTSVVTKEGALGCG